MISNIMDNHFIDISISPRDGHYHAHDPLDIPYSLNHCFCHFPQNFVVTSYLYYFYDT